MDLPFYNIEGRPVAYSEDGIHIYLYSGEPVAYMDRESVYSFDGTHLGWFTDGWVRDHDGNVVFFSDRAKGGPLKPLKQLDPLKSLKSLRPLKGLKELKPLRPLYTLSWSSFSDEEFFQT